jgi:hypothetical protein
MNVTVTHILEGAIVREEILVVTMAHFQVAGGDGFMAVALHDCSSTAGNIGKSHFVL